MSATEMNTDGFDDVDIDNVSEITSPDGKYPAHSSLGYLYRKNKSVQHIPSADIRSTTCLVSNMSNDDLPVRFSRHHNKTPPTPPKKDQKLLKRDKPDYSPSKKLKQRREMKKEDLENISNIDDSDDDQLDSSMIIFDVPLSQSLVQLTANEKPVQPKLLSLNSNSTKNSSLMSYNHRQSDHDSDLDFNNLSTDAKRLTFEFAQSKSVRAVQESQMRRHIISHMEKHQGFEGDLPNSKLKESLVTTTRPAYLPPKDKEEAQKHLRELKHLQTRAIKHELQLEKDRLRVLEKRQKIIEKDTKTWEKEIIPNFREKIQLSSTRELWWRGVPKQFRKFVWTQLLQTKSIDATTLQKLKFKASKNIKDNTSLVQSISNDISRVFPDLGVFQSTLYDDLLFVLTIYSQYSTYEQSLSGIAAVLLYNIQNVDQTFLSLVGLLQRHLLKSIYSTDSSDHKEFQAESESFLRTFAKKSPSLYDHFHTVLKLDIETYITPLLKTLFTNILSLDVVSSIMDVYVFEGDSMLWRCILGLFDKIGYKLYGNEQEIKDIIGKDSLVKLNHGTDGSWFKYVDVGDEIEFLGLVRQVLKK